jgi:hypothetical protein
VNTKLPSDLALALLREQPAPEVVIAAIKGAEAPLYDGGAYDLNLLAVRHPSRTDNTFNDFLHVLYRPSEGAPWKVYSLRVTTDPGTFYRQNPSRVAGTAILKAGHHKGCWVRGLHKGEKRALVQAKPVTVWRDGDRDTVLDMEPGVTPTETGTFGINIHRAGKLSTQVDKWSAGCVVAQEEVDFEEFLALCDLQVSRHPTWTTFSLLLLEA